MASDWVSLVRVRWCTSEALVSMARVIAEQAKLYEPIVVAALASAVAKNSQVLDNIRVLPNLLMCTSCDVMFDEGPGLLNPPRNILHNGSTVSERAVGRIGPAVNTEDWVQCLNAIADGGVASSRTLRKRRAARRARV